MSKVTLVDSLHKGCWFVDLWSDGTLSMFSTYRGKKIVNLGHFIPIKQYAFSTLFLPKYVQQMVEDLIALYVYHSEQGDLS